MAVTVFSDERNFRILIAMSPQEFEKAAGRFFPKVYPSSPVFLPLLFESLGPEGMLYAGYGAVMREAIGGSI